MFTTNMSSKGLAATYVQRAEEIATLGEIARKMEHLVVSQPSFEDDPVFQRLEMEYREQLQRVLSLSLT
jgi:hypothetical protein